MAMGEQAMKYSLKIWLIIISFCLVTSGCKDERLALGGNWSLFVLEYEGIDISGTDKPKSAWFAQTMVIDPSKEIIIIPSDFGINECKYSIDMNEGQFFINTNSCGDVRLNGRFELFYDTMKVFNKGMSMTIGLTVKNKDFGLYAETNILGEAFNFD